VKRSFNAATIAILINYPQISSRTLAANSWKTAVLRDIPLQLLESGSLTDSKTLAPDHRFDQGNPLLIQAAPREGKRRFPRN
jgi:hypothetical protein